VALGYLLSGAFRKRVDAMIAGLNAPAQDEAPSLPVPAAIQS
jgi:hypothetical protein